MGNPDRDWGKPVYPSTTPGKKSVRTDEGSGKTKGSLLLLAILVVGTPVLALVSLVGFIAYGNFAQ